MTFAQSAGDFWLQQNGLQPWEWSLDHDGDSYSAAEEYAANTDPFDFHDALLLELVTTPTEATVFWDSKPGSRYDLMGTSDLENLALSIPITPTLTGNGMRIEVTDPTEPNTFFYLLRALEPTDVDGDNLSSVEEGILGTDPLSDDSDGDGRTDGSEVFRYLSDPLVFDPPGGIIRGEIKSDPNNDGNTDDGELLANVTVYLDENFNGERDFGERSTVSDSNGRYEFLFVEEGNYHLRQELLAPNVQTFPAEASPISFDLLPDEVLEYVHAEPGVGNFDEPYGENASSDPSNITARENTGLGAEPVDLDLVLQAIGVRAKNPASGGGTLSGQEFLNLPEGATITLGFEETIIDGPGPDFLIYSAIPSPNATEEVRVSVGPSVDDLTFIGIARESEGIIPIDLADSDYRNEVQVIHLESTDNGGDWKGFEFTGIEVLNVIPPDSSAYQITVTETEILFEDRDFGRYFRDLPPTLILDFRDNVPETLGLRAGESASLIVRAFDDLGVETITATVNGQTVSLDDNNTVIIPLPNAGKIYATATITDTGGQVVEQENEYYISNADGTPSIEENVLGQVIQSSENAPTARILSPSPGVSSDEDLEILADLFGSPPVTSWTVEYAPADLIDPYDLNADDLDYIELASGSQNLYSDVAATLPLSTLADGIYFIRIKATNEQGQFATYGQAIAKNVDASDLRPVITLTTAEAMEEVMITKEIRGTINSVREVREWFVEYAPSSEVDTNDIGAPNVAWTRLAEGSGIIEMESSLALFDATILKNDRYLIRVVARNDLGLGQAEFLAIEVTGEAKLGRNRLEFDDIQIELAGFPLQLTRVYDSLQADEEGDFGFGWSLKLQDADIRETVPTTGSGPLFGSTPYRVGSRVYLTTPTGERVGFTFQPEFAAGGLFGASYRANFESDAGVYYQLEVPEGDSGFLSLNDDGTMALFGFGFPWNPDRFVLVAPDGNRFTYHESQGFLEAEDLNGNKITLNPNGISHSSGPNLIFTRDADGRITSVTDPASNTWSYSYDAEGNLATVLDPEGQLTTYHYLSDPAHYLGNIVDSQGRMPRRFEYDNGRLIAIIDENGNRQEATWDPAGFQGTRTDARGNVRIIDFNSRGNTTRELAADGSVTTYEYTDPANPDRETKMTDGNGVVWDYLYNAQGQTTSIKTPIFRTEETASYDERGNILELEDYQSQVNEFEYDSQSNLTVSRPADLIHTTLSYNSEGLITQERRGTHYERNLTYDAEGLFAGESDTLGFSATFTNSGQGQPLTATTSEGTVTNVFNSKGEVIGQTHASGNSNSVVKNPDGSTTETNRLGDSTTIARDADERILSVTQPGGSTFSYTYDGDGNPATVTDPEGNTTTFSFDANNLLSSIMDAVGRSQSFTRDAVGNPTIIIDRNGRKRSFEYDALRRPTVERWHDDNDEVIRTLTFTHGFRGSYSEVVDTADGEEIRILNGGSSTRRTRVRFFFPNMGEWRVNTVWDSAATSPEAISVVPGLGVASAAIRARYHADRSYSLSWAHPEGSLRNNLDLERAPDGRVTQMTRTFDDPVTTRLTYDDRARLTGMRHQNEDDALLDSRSEMTISYDAEDQPTSIIRSDNTSTISYDALGQLTSVTHTDASVPSETYNYDLAGNRSSHTITALNRVTSDGLFTYEYDLEGNVISRTDINSNELVTFSYDHRNRLSGITTRPAADEEPSRILRYQYDYLDRLISRSVDGAKTWIINERNMPIAEVRDGETRLSASFFYDPSQTDDFHGVWRDDLGERWLLKDQLGSVQGILDEEGNLLSWVDYDRFGNRNSSSAPAGDEPLGFAGRFEIPGLGFYENRRRLYDPTLGRFLQEDPIKFGGFDTNLYRYAFNQPTTFVDPTGETAAISTAVLQFRQFVNKKKKIPCQIAKSVGKAFGFFSSVSEIIKNAGSGNPAPSLRYEPIKPPGC